MSTKAALVGLLVVTAVLAGVSAHAALITVTSLDDSGDPGTLRTALTEANTNAVPDTITFHPGLSGGTIILDASLGGLYLTEASTTMDGDLDDDGRPDIALDGGYAASGLAINANECVIRGLCLSRCQNSGLSINSVADCRVFACYIGTDLSGTEARPNLGQGIFANGCASVLIGGTAATQSNVISGNLGNGVYLSNCRSSVVQNAFLGLARNGSTALSNKGSGVYAYASPETTIGCAGSPVKTVCSGNASYGIYIYNSPSSKIVNCRVGVTSTGTQRRPNNGFGLYMIGSDNTMVGVPGAAGRNVISGNTNDGVYASACDRLVVKGNYIGANAAGDAGLGNAAHGINLNFCSGAVIGGRTAAERNVIAANRYAAINAYWLADARIVGNYLGTGKDGLRLLPNRGNGVDLRESSNVAIGGTASGERNVIICSQTGLSIDGYSTNGITAYDNYVGYAADGATTGPGTYGAFVSYASGVAIGKAAGGNRMVGTDTGIFFSSVGGGCSATGNRLGVPSPATAIGGAGINASDCAPLIDGNECLRMASYGIFVSGAKGKPIARNNTMRQCGYGVYINSAAKPNLGDLGNVSTADDGNNLFAGSAYYAVYSATAENIKAEGNTWGSAQASVIDGRIYDQLDNAAVGLVDYNPLQGGVIPSAVVAAAGGMSVAAVPTGSGGSQIVVTLAAPGDLGAEILNLAGRSVQALPPTAAAAGVNSLLWNGRSRSGTRVPAGTYLCRVTCRGRDGRQQSQVARVTLKR